MGGPCWQGGSQLRCSLQEIPVSAAAGSAPTVQQQPRCVPQEWSAAGSTPKVQLGPRETNEAKILTQSFILELVFLALNYSVLL